MNRLDKAGRLRDGYSGTWQWKRAGEEVASINMRMEADRLHLSYHVPNADGGWENVVETIRIDRVACRFGGTPLGQRVRAGARRRS